MAIAAFFLLAAMAVAAAVAMLFQRNAVNSCLCLVLAFFALAGLYVLLGSPFIAAIQVIVYAGAIMVLFLFVIMLLNLTAREQSRKRPRVLPFAVAFGLMLFIELVVVLKSPPGQAPASQTAETTVEEIGTQLFTHYIYPFELSSVLILAAIVGAVMLAKKKL